LAPILFSLEKHKKQGKTLRIIAIDKPKPLDYDCGRVRREQNKRAKTQQG
jgi:hypothetical protein